jgi:hypothetical protein
VVEAAGLLAAGLDAVDGGDEPLAADIVARFLDRWEEYEGQADGAAALRNCIGLAKYCQSWAQGAGKLRVTSLAAEATVLSGGVVNDTDETEKPAAAGDENSARYAARLAMAKGQWERAGQDWGGICQRKIAESKGDERPWDWWRAKYYQLYCWSKGKDATKDELARRVSVTLSSCGPVPPLWEKKLRAM